MAYPTRVLALLLLVALAASACSSGDATATDGAADGTDTTAAAGGTQITDQLSLEPAPEPTEADDTTGVDTTDGAASDDSEVDASEGTEGEDASPLETPLELGCAEDPTGRWLVNVRLDDADGGLHLRTGAGTSNDILLPLPTGTEVAALGGCEVTDTGREWFELMVVTDPELSGWAAADWLEPLTRTACPSGSVDTSGLVGIRTARGDFDGDGATDELTVGNHEEGEVAVLQVVFADGGYARGDAEILSGEILRPFRPIGAARDIALVFDGLTSGAATASHAGVEVRDCAVRVFEGVYENGGLTGQGGWCLEATSVGARIWSWAEPPMTDIEIPTPVTWSASMYHGGALVETPALTFDDRWCVPPLALGSTPGTPLAEAGLVGVEASDPWNLAFRLMDELSAGPDAELFRVAVTPGPDNTGNAVFDMVGLQGDAIVGFRLEFDWIPGNEGIATTSVTSTAMCGRGTTDDGLCV
jgi:hypothetical protein